MFRGMYRVKDLTDFPLLPNLSLPEDPSDFRWCESLTTLR